MDLRHFKNDRRIEDLRVLISIAREISIEYGEDARRYPLSHPKGSPFNSGIYSQVVGVNLGNLVKVIMGERSLHETGLNKKAVQTIDEFIGISREKILNKLGEHGMTVYRNARSILKEIIDSGML